jgi:SAM-dependent methyltransferase
MFDNSKEFIACLSVIEHDVDVAGFFKEIGRVLRHGSHLFLSFDYWETPMETGAFKVFCRAEVEEMIRTAAVNGLTVVGPAPDFRCDRRVIHHAGLAYTFFNLLFRRSV